MFSVIINPRANKQFKKLSEKDQARVIIALRQIGQNPYGGEKLQGELFGYWSDRVWPYRIIYMIEKKIITVTVVAIGDRKDVYERLHRSEPIQNP